MSINLGLKQRWTEGSVAAGADLPVVIREAARSDLPSLRRLAQRDSSALPAEPLIVAEVGGEIRAAASVSDGRAIADPFRRTAELAALAELRAAQLRTIRRRGPRVVARTARASAAPLPGAT